MAGDDERPFEGRHDKVLKRIDRYLDRLSIGLLIALIPICQARLPHYRDIALSGLACALVPVLFALAVKIGKRAGLVGQDVLADKRTPSIVDDSGGTARPIIAIVERDVTTNTRSAARNPAKAVESHQGFVAGVGTFTYRVAEHQSGKMQATRR